MKTLAIFQHRSTGPISPKRLMLRRICRRFRLGRGLLDLCYLGLAVKSTQFVLNARILAEYPVISSV